MPVTGPLVEIRALDRLASGLHSQRTSSLRFILVLRGLIGGSLILIRRIGLFRRRLSRIDGRFTALRKAYNRAARKKENKQNGLHLVAALQIASHPSHSVPSWPMTL